MSSLLSIPNVHHIGREIMDDRWSYEKTRCPVCGEYAAKLYRNGYYMCCSNNWMKRCRFWGTLEDAKKIKERNETITR